MEIHLKLVGIILIGIALIHVGFPKKFKWKEELSSLSLINQQMMVVHTFRKTNLLWSFYFLVHPLYFSILRVLNKALDGETV